MEGRVGLGFLVAQAETKPQICLSGGKDGGGNGNVIPPLTLCVGLCLLRETQSGSGAASGRRPAAGPRSHVGSSVPSETEQRQLHSRYEDAERCPSFPRFHCALPLSLGAITQSGRTCKLGPVLCSLEDRTVTLLRGTLPIKLTYGLALGSAAQCSESSGPRSCSGDRNPRPRLSHGCCRTPESSNTGCFPHGTCWSPAPGGNREETLFTKENSGAADFSLVLLTYKNVRA